MPMSITMLLGLRKFGLFCVTALLSGFLLSQPAQALESDTDQPISVLANSAEFTPDQGIAIYTGNVEIEQGSLKVDAHKVTVYRKADGEIDKIIAEGKDNQVHLQQQPKPEDPVVHAYAMSIVYQAALQEVELTRQAELENGKDQFSGERIRYHLQTKRIQAWGQDNNKDAPSDDGRVKIILFPNNGKEQK